MRIAPRVTAATTSIDIATDVMHVVNDDTVPCSVMSHASTSFVNRFTSRPVGCVSKNDIGSESSFCTSVSCSCWLACSVESTSVTARKSESATEVRPMQK